MVKSIAAHKFLSTPVAALEMKVDQIEEFIYGMSLAFVFDGDSGTIKISDEKDMKNA